MPITLITGPANAGKAHAVLQALRTHAARGEDPWFVVPTEADQARYRREIAEQGPFLGVRVERFEGLLRELLGRAGQTRAPLGSLAREHILARLAGTRPGVAHELARFVAELEIERVTPARLRSALSLWRSISEDGEQEPATLELLCSTFERYRELLAQLRRADRELLIGDALDELRRKPALWGSTPVLLYGFDDFTELQLDAIETLGGAVGARVTLSLAFEPGRVAFAGRATTFQRLIPQADTHTELPARAQHYAAGSREALHHLERSLLNEQVTRIETGAALKLLEGGTPRAELELVAGEIRTLLDGDVQAGEIAIVHRAPERISALIGEVLEDYAIPYALHQPIRFAQTAVGRGLLGMLRCALGEGQLADLLAWLGAPGVLTHPQLADRLEANARREGVLDAAGARALWENEHWPLDNLDRMNDAASAGTHVLIDLLANELQRLFRAPRNGMAAVLEDCELPEAHALIQARRALEELRELARYAPAYAPSPNELIGLLEQLESTESGSLRADRVAIVDPLSLRARRVRMLFACGLQEGIFPALAKPHPLLSGDDRRKLAHVSGLVLRGELDTLAAERYLLYALCSRPEERLTLSWHTAEEDGTPLARSLFVDDICDLFERSLEQRTVRRLAGTNAAARGARAPRPLAPLRDRDLLEQLRERTLWSASSLESWNQCPVKWFIERLLHPERIDPDPEPLARGGLAHAVLKITFEGLRERTGSARLTPASLGIAKRLLREALSELQAEHRLSVAPERLPGVRRRLQVDLERYLKCASEQENPLQPTHFELEFGFEKEGPGPLELGEGVSLRGRIDRIDIGPAGEAVVYDYKGRLAPPHAKWVSEGSFQVALYMLATQQLLGCRPLGGFYQPLAGKDIRARGVLDADSELELDCVRTDRLEHGEMQELLDECLTVALEAASEARSGALEPRPDTCAYNGGCSYPTICRCER